MNKKKHIKLEDNKGKKQGVITLMLMKKNSRETTRNKIKKAMSDNLDDDPKNISEQKIPKGKNKSVMTVMLIKMNS